MVVFNNHHAWLRSHVSDKEINDLYFVTCGKWDLMVMLPQDMEKLNVKNYPKIYKRFINIKDIFKNVTKYKKGLVL